MSITGTPMRTQNGRANAFRLNRNGKRLDAALMDLNTHGGMRPIRNGPTLAKTILQLPTLHLSERSMATSGGLRWMLLVRTKAHTALLEWPATWRSGPRPGMKSINTLLFAVDH